MGISKLALKLPLPSVLTDVGLVVIVSPSKVIVTDLLALNPVPLTSTSSPPTPEVGMIVISGSTVNSASA